jgi:hypothetical protein
MVGNMALTNKYETVALRGDSTEGKNVGRRKVSVALKRAVLSAEPRRKKIRIQKDVKAN